MTAIDTRFADLRRQGRKAFIPFVTAGDPDIATTGQAIRELDAAGCHVIEIGFPFSDPIADGPVIQASYTRALDRGLKLKDVLECARQATPAIKAPLVGMVSYTLVHHGGVEAFLDRAAASGFRGLIVPDLPMEEAGEFARLCGARGLANIMLVAPTTPPARAEKIARIATGFLYCISVAGITGERDRLPDELLDHLSRLRSMTDLPLCVGFGVSRPEHVAMLRDHADGVIVGSAIVRRLERAATDWPAAKADVRALVDSLILALNPA